VRLTGRFGRMPLGALTRVPIRGTVELRAHVDSRGVVALGVWDAGGVTQGQIRLAGSDFAAFRRAIVQIERGLAVRAPAEP